MNYYNPYFFIPKSRGILGILKNFNLGSIINNTSKTLNVINQAIPVVKEVSPLLKNAKTMFKVMSEFNRPDTVSNVDTDVEIERNVNTNSNLTFFQ